MVNVMDEVTIKFSFTITGACGYGTLKTNQTRLGMTQNTFTPSLHLWPFCCHLHKYALCLLVVCRGGLWKVVGWAVVGV